ncbi:MAG TPA: DUF1848 family protein [Spirochaetota bacterium]|nr:DUF1848 family protein [Spirochaetota bacterium]HOL57163.1 DUF1848 family protein [Spirochaetota bacterium]HPP04779.1 DUF1848 family protein [Spirochaetota bacterium]
MNRTIVTFSRRTDGGLYIEWLIDKLKKGFCQYPNPVSGKIITQSLTKDSIIFLSLWTKLPNKIVPYIKELINLVPLNIQVTLNCYGNAVEKNIPSKNILIDSFKRISECMKNINLINWRYDPVMLSEKFNIEWHLNNFYDLCKNLNGFTNRVMVSLVQLTGSYFTLFSKVKENRINDNDRLIMFDKETFFNIIEKFISIAKEHGIELNICCEPHLDPKKDALLFKKFGSLYKGCISEKLVREFEPFLKIKKTKGQRKNCLCCDCHDIGVYHTCSNGCIYCYANRKSSYISDKISSSF